MKQKNSETSGEVGSLRALARLVGKTHTTVDTWRKRDDWPFPVNPPWPIALVSKIIEWAEENIHEGGGPVRREHEAMMKTPGRMKLTWQTVTDPKCPFHISRIVGDELVGEQTVDDLQTFADHLNAAMSLALEAASKALGENEFRTEAPAEYYNRLLDAVCGDEELAAEFSRLLNNFGWTWAGRRYKGTPGWSKRLPNPPDNFDEAEFANDPPLKHRAATVLNTKETP